MGIKNKVLLICLNIVLFSYSLHAQNQKSSAETKKQAEALFENGNYTEAAKLYNQLVTLYPKDAMYNCYYGACLLFTDKDKDKSLKYLEYASSRPDVDAEAFYFLGLGYHYNYRFNDAIVNYKKFLEKANSKALKKYPAQQQLRMANNGFELIKNISEPKVLEKKTLKLTDFHLAYKLENPNIKLVKAPSYLLSDYDRKQSYSPLIAVDKSSDTLFISTMGKDGSKGSDIEMLILDEEGQVKTRILLDAVNTEFDEAFPYFDKTNNTLYFASKGHNSYGGFDIFRISVNPKTGTWGSPQNLDYAYNTPDDDFLYVPLEDGENAYFSSTRNNNADYVTTYKVDAAIRPLQRVLLTGIFKDEKSGKPAKITIEDLNTNQKLPSFDTRARDGFYMVKLESGHKYRFLVEPFASQIVHSGNVDIPTIKELKALKQEMFIVYDGDKERLVIKNLFDEKPSEEDDKLLAQFLLSSQNLEEKQEVERNIALSDGEIIDDLQQDIASQRKQIGELEQIANGAIYEAQQKNQLANQDFELSQQLSKSDDENTKAEASRLFGDAQNHASNADASFAFAQLLEKDLVTKRADLEVLMAAMTQVRQASAEEKRNDVVKTYLNTKDKVKVSKVSSADQASRILEDEKIKALKLSNEKKTKYLKLYDQQQKLEKDLAYQKAQLNQAKKAKLKKEIEESIKAIEADLTDLNPQVKKAFDEFSKAERRANTFDSESKAIVQNAVKSKNETISDKNGNDALAIQNTFERLKNQDDLNKEYQFSADSQTISQNDENTQQQKKTSRSTELKDAQNDENKSESIVENSSTTTQKDKDGEPNRNETNQATVQPRTTSPEVKQEFKEINQHYTSRQLEVNKQNDPVLRTKQELVLYENWYNDLAKELQTVEQSSLSEADKKERTTAIKREQNTLLAKQQAAKINYNRSAFNLKPYQPGDALLNNSEIQDLEDRFFFDYSRANSESDVDKRAEKLLGVNANYIVALEDAREGADAETQAKLQLLLDQKKREKSYFTNLLEVEKSVEAYTFKEEKLPPSTLASESETKTQSSEVNSALTEPVAKSNSQENQNIEEETETLSGEENLALSEPMAESKSEENQQPEEQTTPKPAARKHYTSTDELRRAPLHFGDSPYNTKFRGELNTLNTYKSPLTKAKKEYEIREDWRVEMEKELEVLNFTLAASRDENTRELISGKIDKVSAQLANENIALEALNQQILQMELDGVEEEELIALAENTPSIEEPELPGVPEETIEEVQEEQESSALANQFTSAEEPSKPENENQEVSNNVEVEEINNEPISTPTPSAEPKAQSQEITEPKSASKNQEQQVVEPQIPEKPTKQEVESELEKEEFIAETAKAEEIELATEVETTTEVEVPTPIELPKVESGSPVEQKIANIKQEQANNKEQENKIEEERNALEATIKQSKKKKQRKALEIELEKKETELNEIRQLNQKTNQAIAKTIESGNEIVNNPLSNRPSEEWIENKKTSERNAQLARQDLEDLEAEIGSTRKKKTRKALQTRVPEAMNRVLVNELEAKRYAYIANKVNDIEETILKTETPYGERVMVELPKKEFQFTESEVNDLQNKSSVREYKSEYEKYQKLIQEAEVLYIEANAASGDQKSQLEANAKSKKQDAFYTLNNANRALMLLPENPDKERIIAFASGTFKTMDVDALADWDNIPEELNSDIFNVNPSKNYYDAKPIPLNPKLPKGLVYKVQVGAFRNPIPTEVFKGFTPLTGESAGAGLTRYTAGYFKDFTSADQAKNSIRGMGYSDAFVVAYMNGERISLSNARQVSGGAQSATSTVASSQEVNTLTSSQTSSTKQPADVVLAVQKVDVRPLQAGEKAEVVEVTQRGDLFYTVQVGVYLSEVDPSVMLNVNPLNAERTSNNTIRYSSGVYSSVTEATQAKNNIVDMGISDAFVTAYYKGERISVARARELAATAQTTTTTVPVEVSQSNEIEVLEQGIAIKEEPNQTKEETLKNTDPVKVESPSQTSVQTATPSRKFEPTGTKIQPRIVYMDGEDTVEELDKTELPPQTGSTEMAYKVVVGPYFGEVSFTDASVIFEMSSVGIKVDKQEESTYYILGNYATQAEAEQLQRIIIQKGLKPEGIAKFVNGEKVVE